MSKPLFSKRNFIAFLITTLVGCSLHFLYDWIPGTATALISPASESIWEHLKLIFWPYLAAMLIVAKKDRRGRWLFTLLVISVAMLAVGYVYHISLGRSNVVFDIGLYVFLMAVGFWLPERLNADRARSFPVLFLTVLLGGAIILFTFLPPDYILFTDLSEVHTWYTIPC